MFFKFSRLAALWRCSRSRPVRRFVAAVSGGGKGSLCDISAALSPAPGSPLCGGVPARARFAASVRRSRSRPARRFVAALSLTLGSPPSVSGGGFRLRQRLFLRPFGGALARARLAASVRRSRSRPVRRFGAALPPAPGSPLLGGGFRRRQRLFVRPSGGAPAHARFAALWRRSRSRSVRRFVAALSLALGSPLFGGALARARLAARSARAQSRAQKMPALFF